MDKPLLYTSTTSAEHELLCEQYDRAKEVSENPTRPSHYGGEGHVFEVFNVLEAWGLDKDFYLGNVVKYVVRAGKKNKSKEKEDLQKALVYLQKRIDTL